MPVLTFDKILKIISTILSILSYAIGLLTGDKDYGENGRSNNDPQVDG